MYTISGEYASRGSLKFTARDDFALCAILRRNAFGALSKKNSTGT
jgi:hypothetical protein